MEPKTIVLPALKSVARIDSEINGVIRIKRFGDNIRAMVFGETDECYQSIYDVSNLETVYLPYINSLLTFLNHIDKFDNMLIIGLGGGQIPMLISDKFSVKMDIIELDPAVLDATERMGFKKSDKMNIHISDGVDFIDSTTDHYDVIIIDLDKPESFDNFDFEEIKPILNNDGVLVINCGEDDGKEILSDILRKYFKSIRMYHAYGQYVYLCKIGEYDFYNERISDYMKAFSNYEKIIKEANG